MTSSKLNSVKQWKSSVNIDYLSLYIKTWFEFLATVQELHPEHIAPTGDKGVISEYIENIVIPDTMDELNVPLHLMYKLGYDLMKDKYPDSFFGQFYTINKSFSERFEFKNKHAIKIEYRNTINTQSGENPNLLITLNSSIKKFKANIGAHYLTINIPLTNLINHKSTQTSNFIFLSNEECIKVIHGELANEISNKVIATGTSKVQEKTGYCLDELSLTIQEIRLSENEVFDDLFHMKTHRGYYDSNDYSGNEIKILKWFILFNYHIRNLLFHSIIDPFDENCLKLFKHAYLVLEGIVEHNIERIRDSA